MPQSADNTIDWVTKMNKLGSKKLPFIFILDYELKTPIVYALSELPKNIFYKCNQHKNYQPKGIQPKKLVFEKEVISFDEYKRGFDIAKREILLGNSFLLNLTYPTTIRSNYSLKEMFFASHAKYKLYYLDKFIVSSPEIFVQIKDGKIYTYPMKGTINADIPNAEKIILADAKETAEHYTIVDLLRNDLSQIAKNVNVEKFRYIDVLTTNEKRLLQVSSEIVGDLEEDYHHKLGDIFARLLPAGSISGAPKKKTCDIIRSAEIDERGFYTGVFGVYDGKCLDSGVMIRYIENDNNTLKYRSGCGITSNSDLNSEYQELIDKVYLPIYAS
jgi:para-aminobenzoate synthetase component I